MRIRIQLPKIMRIRIRNPSDWKCIKFNHRPWWPVHTDIVSLQKTRYGISLPLAFLSGQRNVSFAVFRILGPVPLWPRIRDPWSGKGFCPYPGSGIPDPKPILRVLNENFFGLKVLSCKIGQNFFSSHVQKYNNLNFCDICGYKQKKIFFPLCFVAVSNPGSEIRDPG